MLFASKRQVGSKTRLLWETPCKLIEDERSLVAAISSEKCVEDELPKPSNAYGRRSSSSRHLHGLQFCDQAANLFEVLAWSYSLKSVLRTAYIFDVFRGDTLCIRLLPPRWGLKGSVFYCRGCARLRLATPLPMTLSPLTGLFTGHLNGFIFRAWCEDR